VNANPILLQKKYARIIDKFAKSQGITLADAMDIFYKSDLYLIMKDGISDMHCMSDEYLVEELEDEIKEKGMEK